jgi:hypothetical protein
MRSLDHPNQKLARVTTALFTKLLAPLKLSQTIRPLQRDASNEQNDSTRFDVSLLKNESLVVLVTAIPRNKVTWDTVSFAPHP